jgi:hypothetical protein
MAMSAAELLRDVGTRVGAEKHDVEPIIQKVVQKEWYKSIDSLLELTKNGTDSTQLETWDVPHFFCKALLDTLQDFYRQRPRTGRTRVEDPDHSGVGGSPGRGNAGGTAGVAGDAAAEEGPEVMGKNEAEAASAISAEEEGPEAKSKTEAEAARAISPEVGKAAAELVRSKAADELFDHPAVQFLVTEQAKTPVELDFKMIAKDGHAKILLEDFKAWSTTNLALTDKKAEEEFQYLDTYREGYLNQRDLQKLLDGLLGPMYKIRERIELYASCDCKGAEALASIEPGAYVVGLGDPQEVAGSTWVKVKANKMFGWVMDRVPGGQALEKTSDPEDIWKSLDEHFKKRSEATQAVHHTPSKRLHDDDQDGETKMRRVDPSLKEKAAAVQAAAKTGAEKAAAVASIEDQQGKQKFIDEFTSTVYVCGVPCNKDFITNDYMQEKFKELVGPVQRVSGFGPGNKQGFGFVRFYNAGAAKKCLDTKIEVAGVSVKVNAYKPRLWVDSAQSITRQCLREHFAKFGQCDVRLNWADYPYVTYHSVEAAATVLNLHLHTINGMAVRITSSTPFRGPQHVSDNRHGGKGNKAGVYGIGKGTPDFGYGNRRTDAEIHGYSQKQWFSYEKTGHHALAEKGGWY